MQASVGDLVAISGTSANNIYAAGYTTTAAGSRVSVVEQWNGTSWSAVASANPNGILDVTGVTALSNGTVVMVGNTSGTGGGGFIETNATTAAPATSASVPASGASFAPTDTVTPSMSGGATLAAPKITVQGPTVVVLGVLPDGTLQGPTVAPTRRR